MNKSKITFGKISLNINNEEKKEEPSTTGFKKFGKINKEEIINEKIDKVSDDLESQHLKEIMGITSFGRKAKVFDIEVI